MHEAAEGTTGAQQMARESRQGDDAAAAMLYAHERRIGRLEEGHIETIRHLAEMRAEQHRQTTIVGTIATDTSAIRDAVRGFRAMGKFASWAGGITALFVSGYALYGIFRSVT